MLPYVNNVRKSAFYHLRTISHIRKATQTTEILIHAFVTSKLDHCNSQLYNVPKNVINRFRMQLPDWLHGLGSVITLLPSSSIFTGYLFLNELDSRFYYLPSKLCNSNLQPTFKTLSPPTYLLDRFSHPLRSVWILLALTLRPMGLEHFLSQPPNFETNHLTTCAHARIQVFLKCMISGNTFWSLVTITFEPILKLASNYRRISYLSLFSINLSIACSWALDSSLVSYEWLSECTNKCPAEFQNGL